MSQSLRVVYATRWIQTKSSQSYVSFTWRLVVLFSFFSSPRALHRHNITAICVTYVRYVRLYHSGLYCYRTFTFELSPARIRLRTAHIGGTNQNTKTLQSPPVRSVSSRVVLLCRAAVFFRQRRRKQWEMLCLRCSSCSCEIFAVFPS